MSDLRDQLLKVREEHGALTPVILKEAVRPRGHPLHSRVFDRPAREAAEAYYTARAHELIQEAMVTYRKPGEQSQTIRAFRPVPRASGEIVYDPVEEIAEDPFARELVLREMERAWRSLHERYKDFSEFVTMVKRDVA